MIRLSSVGFATLSVIPSAKGFGAALSKGVGPGMDRAGRAGGKRFGGGMLHGAKSFVAPIVTLFAAKVGVDFLKGAISNASDLGESTSKVGVVFGKFSKQVVDSSKTSAGSMGLSQNAYLGAAGTLGNLLVSLKIAPKAAAGMSQQMVKLAGDMASFNNVSPEEALAAIKSGLTGETEPLKAFGVNMNDATLKAQALKMHLIKTTKEAMSPQTKALAAQALIMAQTGTAQGDFARTSGGLANQQRILAAKFEDVKTKIGGVFLPVVTKIVSFLNKNMIPAFTTVSGGISALIAAFQAGGDDITSSGFAGGMERIGLAGRKVSDWVSGTGIPALKNFATTINDNKGKIAVIAGVITALLIPVLIRMGVQHTIAAGKAVAAWVLTKVHAVTSAAAQVAASYRIIGGWVASATAAVVSGAQTVYIWGLYKIEAIKGAAITVASHARMTAAWVASKGSAVAQAAATSAAWVASAVATSAAWVASTSRTIAGLARQKVAMLASRAVMIAVAVGTGIWTAAQWLLNAALTANPIGIVVVAVAALVAGIIWVATKTTWFQSVWKVMTNALAAAWRWLWNTVLAPIIRFVLGGFATITEGIANMLRVLSNIPGFGWAKTAADKMAGAATKARNLANNIKDIPSSKTVAVGVHYRVTGSIKAAQDARLKGLPGNAAGTSNWRGGLTWVGERGPEILNLPKGSQIIPNHKTSVPASTPPGTSVTINGNVGWSADEVANRIAVQQRDAAAMFNLAGV